MPGTVLIRALFHGLVQKEWQSPDGAFKQHLLDLHWLYFPPLLYTADRQFSFPQIVALYLDRVAMPVALCTDVDIWHMLWLWCYGQAVLFSTSVLSVLKSPFTAS